MKDSGGGSGCLIALIVIVAIGVANFIIRWFRGFIPGLLVVAGLFLVYVVIRDINKIRTLNDILYEKALIITEKRILRYVRELIKRGSYAENLRTGRVSIEIINNPTKKRKPLNNVITTMVGTDNEIVFKHSFNINLKRMYSDTPVIQYGEEYKGCYYQWSIDEKELLLGDYSNDIKSREVKETFENEYKTFAEENLKDFIDEKLLSAYEKYLSGDADGRIDFAEECLQQGYIDEGYEVLEQERDTCISKSQIIKCQKMLGACCEQDDDYEEALLHYSSAVDAGDSRAIADYLRLCIAERLISEMPYSKITKIIEKKLLKQKDDNLAVIVSVAFAYAGLYGGKISKTKSGALFSMVIEAADKESLEYIKSEIGLIFLEGENAMLPRDLRSKAETLFNEAVRNNKDNEAGLLMQKYRMKLS